MQLLLRRLFLFLSLAATLGLIPRKALATHLAGSDITYTCLGGNSYRIDLTFYRDCQGTVAPPSVVIEFQSISCNIFFTDALLPVSGTGQEITYPCPGLVTSCSDSNSANPGIQEYHYSGVVNFPMQCADWVISWTYCCRNCDITTIQLSQPCVPQQNPGMYINANLDNLNAPCNNSPTFTNNPIVFVCVGQSFTYNHGAVDPDGDSLVYSLVDALTNAGSPVPYLSGFNADTPIVSSPALALDPVTGDITMTPTTQQVGVLSVLVEEYRNGVLIGHVVRDMEIYVKACTNNLPTATGINGTNVRDTTICPGTNLCFDINSNDADTGQIVTMTWNGAIVTGTFVTSGSPHPTGQFCWVPDVTDISANPHQFTVTVVDNACPNSGYQTYSFNILVNSPLMNITVTDISCHGLTDGSISVVPVNPGGYSYLWSPGGQTTSSISGLGAGTYYVTVFDSTTGCTATFPNTIIDPLAISDSMFVITASCTGATSGAAGVIASGGTPGYTYSWNTVPPTANDTVTNIGPGTYTVTITDSRGCTHTDSITVNASSSAITITVDSVSTLLCYTDNNGIATISASGGTLPYTYAWSTNPVQTDTTATGLSPGTYYITVTDSLGCSTTDSATVSSPPPISMVGGAVSASCFVADGIAFVTVSGGVPGYTYVWTGQSSTDDSLINVTPGLYEVITTDANNCTGSLNVLVQSAVISSTADVVSQTGCSGTAGATAVATASGGTAPYTYNWNSVPPQSNDTAFNLPSGVWSVTITDATGCFTVDTVNVQNPPVIDVDIDVVNAACAGGSLGSATAHVTGGVPPFTFSWTSGSTDSIASGLAPGTYYVTITDANGCVVNDSAVVGQDSPITITIDNFVQPTCNGGSDASIDITVAGGSGQYSFSWNGGSYITEDLSNIDAGLYTIVVTDNNGCTQTNQVQVNNPPPIPVNAGRDTSICVGSMVQLDADPLQAGQTGVWTGPGGVVFSDINDPHATASNMPAGYTILTWTVTDGATSCSQSDVVSVFGNNNSGGPDIDVCNLGPVTMNASMGTNFVGVWTGSSNVIINDPSMFNTQVNALGYAIEQLIWTVSSSACSNSDTVQVGFYQTPTADAGDSETVCTNKAELHALVTPPGTGVWSVGIPGQALFADSLNPITTAYDIDSVYTYFYWTMTNGICTATDAVLIHFDSDCELELPSGFSPNGDTYNDGYEIRGIEAYPHNVFRVFNRWGNEVYSKVNYQNTDWKGQNKKGDDLPEGTYYVILQITDKDITKNTYVDLRRYTGQK